MMTNQPQSEDREADDQQPPHCAECRQPLYLGDEMIRMETGVLGGNGFVPLPTERTILLCNTECVRRYFMPEEDIVQMKRRVP